MTRNILVSWLLGLLVIMVLSMCLVPKACKATWFKPVHARVLPISLPEGSCAIDTSGFFSKDCPIGFALNFQNNYVVEAAIEPGINGIADTLVDFSIAVSDRLSLWQDASAEFYYGLPKNCSWLSESNLDRTSHPGSQGRISCQWFFSLPDHPRPQANIQEFIRHFNQIGQNRAYERTAFPKTGLGVEEADFTFWAKPEFSEKLANLYWMVRIETASGKKWQQQIHFSKKQQSPDSSLPNH